MTPPAPATTDRSAALLGIGWDHARCMGPLRALAAAWADAGHGEVVWETRSLERFEDEPVAALAARYDLVVLDHPNVGLAVAAGAILPFDPAQLHDQAAGSAGPSHASYHHAGRQWATALDGACQVAALRPDLLAGDVPATWEEALALAAELPGRVALPLAPAHAMCGFLALCAGLGAPVGAEPGRLVDPAAARVALERLATFARLGPPAALEWSPPRLLAAMVETDELAYAPLLFVYSSYAEPAAAGRPCAFAVPPRDGARPPGSLLGGAGLAVSAATARPEAVAFAAFAASGEAQATLVPASGGQPASRAGWAHPRLAAGGCSDAVLATIESAWVRPRDPWWPAFQADGGNAIHAALAAGRPGAETLAALEAIHRAAREAAA